MITRSDVDGLIAKPHLAPSDSQTLQSLCAYDLGPETTAWLDPRNCVDGGCALSNSICDCGLHSSMQSLMAFQASRQLTMVQMQFYDRWTPLRHLRQCDTRSSLSRSTCGGRFQQQRWDLLEGALKERYTQDVAAQEVVCRSAREIRSVGKRSATYVGGTSEALWHMLYLLGPLKKCYTEETAAEEMISAGVWEAGAR